MKRIYLSLFIIAAFISSCDKIENVNTVEFDTTLSTSIPVSVAPVMAAIKSVQADYPFSQSGVASLLDIDDLSKYLTRINTIYLKNIEVDYSLLQDGEEIKTMDISVTGVGVLATITNATSSNTTHSPTIDQEKLTQVSTILNATQKIEITVSGTTSKAPMSCTVNMYFDLHIEANAL